MFAKGCTESIWTVFTETTACLLGQATTGTFLQFFKVMLSQRKHLTVFVTEREGAAKTLAARRRTGEVLILLTSLCPNNWRPATGVSWFVESAVKRAQLPAVGERHCFVLLLLFFHLLCFIIIALSEGPKHSNVSWSPIPAALCFGRTSVHIRARACLAVRPDSVLWLSVRLSVILWKWERDSI